MADRLGRGTQDAKPEGVPTVLCHAHAIEVIDRPEGYREFRCAPSYWTYPADQAVESLAAEALGERRGVDKHGWGEAVEFWSGSDACTRLQAVPPDQLAHRELVALACRRSVGLNAPRPWLSAPLIAPVLAHWKSQTSDAAAQDAHERIDDDGKSLWAHYGMRQSSAEPVIFSYGMRASDRPALGRIGAPWQGGTGTWYRWSTVRDWKRWARRQDVCAEAVEPDAGNLLIFVSHRWEALDHPDPTGGQLCCLQVGLQFSLAKAVLHEGVGPLKTRSGLPELLREFLDAEFAPSDIAALVPWAREIQRAGEAADSEAALLDTPDASVPSDLLAQVQSRILIWYDYCSMLQAPRTESEEAAFDTEILTLNEIQADACTLVIAGDTRYLRRAWCFLELCGGMRHRIVELTPSWGTEVGLGDSITRWAHRSDQLISALSVHGPDALAGSGLASTRPEDLPNIARLLAKLELTGLLATDDSDLVGGSLPVPFRSGAWEILGRGGEPAAEEQKGMPIADSGRLPDSRTLAELAAAFARCDQLSGSWGVWVYTTNRALSLAWAGRVGEWWPQIRSLLVARSDFAKLRDALQVPAAGVACLWADSLSLSEDAAGWTRAIPSTVQTLVILTQADLPSMCRIYDQVVATHHARGAMVVTFCPENGKLLVYPPAQDTPPMEPNWAVNVLAVPRLRRDSAKPNRMFLPAGARREDIEVLAALRLDPRSGIVPEGRLHVPDKDGRYSATDEIVDAKWLLRWSAARTRVEGLARSIAGTWEEWLSRLVHQKYWVGGVVPRQLDILEKLMGRALEASDVPDQRSRYLEFVLDESTRQDTLLPDWLLEDAALQARVFREATSRARRQSSEPAPDP